MNRIYWALLILICATSTQAQKKWKAESRDSVVVPAGADYASASFLRRWIMGDNYRTEWATPVKMPVFHLKTSGLKIVKLGGGQQTLSLQLEDRKGRVWVLRSVDKNAEGALPKRLRNTIAEKVVQDMISAAHPYAALTVGSLARSAGVIAPDPVLYFIPDDPAFGTYRSSFANTVCFLEEKEPTLHNEETESTEKVMQKMVEESEHLAHQKKILRARLLDMVVGDWDRHPDQWRWGHIDSASLNYYYAIPRDRDQAFFMSDGLFPKLAKLVAMPHINGFGEKSTGLKKLNRKSWAFDRFFLNELDGDDWKKVIAELQKRLHDTAIMHAVKRLPPEIFALSGQEIADKLKSRRDGLMENALNYYRYISTQVQVTGSDEKEIFRVSGAGKALVLSVYRVDSGKQPDKIYERRFEPGETFIVTLNGMGGDDQFIVEESADSKIRLRISGDTGKDRYSIKGRVKSKVNDPEAEDRTAVLGKDQWSWLLNR